MIFKIRKKIYEIRQDYAVKNTIGEVVCKIAVLPSGYYIYNKLGLQIAQVTFEENAAKMSIVKSTPTFPGAVKMKILAPNEFKFVTNELDKGDDVFVKAVKGAKASRFSIWGKPSQYNFEIYDGSQVVGSVIPVPGEPNFYQIRTTESTNILYVLMICLASEKLHADPEGKMIFV
ncbi:MAG TPA: hypothetical protein PKX91_02025 [Clostridia bacterium]|jgi:hypothetical protein|nr:hypothetical protein [Clostridia bacterium]